MILAILAAGLTTIPARIGARQSVAEVLHAEAVWSELEGGPAVATSGEGSVNRRC